LQVVIDGEEPAALFLPQTRLCRGNDRARLGGAALATDQSWNLYQDFAPAVTRVHQDADNPLEGVGAMPARHLGGDNDATSAGASPQARGYQSSRAAANAELGRRHTDDDRPGKGGLRRGAVAVTPGKRPTQRLPLRAGQTVTPLVDLAVLDTAELDSGLFNPTTLAEHSQPFIRACQALTPSWALGHLGLSHPSSRATCRIAALFSAESAAG